ncbi:protein translocase subunit SecD [Arthrobacter sp. StoSoilB3]|jgi:preprotein translocase subunit SecD|uniref:Protein translocase subunit SecD n=1 Tax=Paenarthrobacter nicotinovorans TaxID=29320 RepID=A0ABT9TKP9_PAENI|nr:MULTISPECIES: protein translocase subunit SecD [Paenarthrobacter]KQQ99735.1 preprotein translocase subunit SecD [Arthrobacter sp. Leaf145]SKB60737.1 preprotein translocase subunit SecD [Arthrobacter sp. 31Cvi3.1E]BCW40786.1 protein translocase subunit SecD [Arthrobacter sp. StoSoilB3]MDQ0101503.1 preprotein translocase subunit SecD [Paenarthrobacter nicotinovorans]QOT20755.1 protein translocase subunit SecD [Paenarthrobacter sp. YJN-D]
MARTGPKNSARRVLTWLGAIFVVLTAVLAGGVMTGHASWAPKLALDLEGGTQMILAPRVEGASDINEEQLNQAVAIIRQRVDGSGVAEAEISTQSGRNVVVSLPGTPSKETRDLIQASADMNFRPVIAAGDPAAVPAEQRTPDDKLPKPTAEPANASDNNWVTGDVVKEFEALDCVNPSTEKRDRSDPAKPLVACEPATDKTPAVKYILGPVEVKGQDISDSTFSQVQGAQGSVTNSWGVNIVFNGDATAKFKAVTERLNQFYVAAQAQGTEDPKSQFAIVLDDKVISAPRALAVITDGKPQITGNFTQASAKALSDQLRYGALPISFEIQSQEQISATLGGDQLRLGLLAGMIGLLLVVVYSLFQYRALGLVTIASLVVAGLLTYLAIAILGWTENYRLSLAGVAGLIVAIGQTADSFIVYFERIRDELRDGRGLVSAVENGWKRAKRTVLASKAVNLLAALVLYFVAVGNVRGFAFTLGLTALADLLVVFMFTHPMLQVLARTKFFGEGHRFSGLSPDRLGAVPLYRGAGRLRTPDDKPTPVRPRNAGAAAEAERRMTIAERRLAAKGQLTGSSNGSKEEK